MLSSIQALGPNATLESDFTCCASIAERPAGSSSMPCCASTVPGLMPCRRDVPCTRLAHTCSMPHVRRFDISPLSVEVVVGVSDGFIWCRAGCQRPA